MPSIVQLFVQFVEMVCVVVVVAYAVTRTGPEPQYDDITLVIVRREYA